MARVVQVIVAAMTVVALTPTTSVARTPTKCKEVCDHARTSAALTGQQRRLLRTCSAARACTPSSNLPKDVESAPGLKTFQPYPCKFFMC